MGPPTGLPFCYLEDRSFPGYLLFVASASKPQVAVRSKALVHVPMKLQPEFGY